MRILLLSPLPLSDTNDGVKLRGRGLLRSLQALGQVQVLAFEQLSRPGGGDCALPKFPGPWERLLYPVPSLIRCFSSTAFSQMVSRAAVDCDLCVCLGLQMFQYTRSLPPGLPVLLDSYNVECDILWGLARERSGLKKLYWMSQALKLQVYESRALSQAHHVIAISRADEARFLKLAPRTKCTVVPPGLDLSRLLEIAVAPEPDTLTFVGALDWHVNIDCSVWFATKVLPLIRARRPATRFLVVGRNPDPAVRALTDMEGVFVYADVPTIEPYLEKTAAIVVPLRFGSGVQGKVIEGLASGRPVVTSRIGFEGLDLEAGTDLLVCDGAQDFAEKCIRVLEDSHLASALGEKGRLASRRFRLERMQADMRALCAQVVPAAR